QGYAGINVTEVSNLFNPASVTAYWEGIFDLTSEIVEIDLCLGSKPFSTKNASAVSDLIACAPISDNDLLAGYSEISLSAWINRLQSSGVISKVSPVFINLIAWNGAGLNSTLSSPQFLINFNFNLGASTFVLVSNAATPPTQSSQPALYIANPLFSA